MTKNIGKTVCTIGGCSLKKCCVGIVHDWMENES